jgi:hypothetical protein
VIKRSKLDTKACAVAEVKQPIWTLSLKKIRYATWSGFPHRFEEPAKMISFK